MKLFKKRQDLPARRRYVDEGNLPNNPAQASVFKRNRTITGTTSNNLNTPSYKSMDLESNRLHVHHLARKRQKIFGLFLIVLAISTMLWIVVSNFTSRVTVSIGDSQHIVKVVDNDFYIDIIKTYLNSNPSSRLQFLLNYESINDYVSQQAPEVKNIVQLGMANLGETNFVLTMRSPVAGWRIGDKQYYVDEDGISFEKNYYAEPSVQIVDNSGASLDTGTAVVSNRLLSFVGRVVSISSNYGYTVTKVTLPLNTTREVDVNLKGVSFYAKLLVDRPVGEQVEDMANAIKYFKKSGSKPKYIDVRVSGKAFYK